jgi:ATP-dependent helicase/nuclease subunit B
MEPFLDRLAKVLMDQHRNELDQIAVVLPGRRAGIHLRKYLAKAAGTTIWCPELLDMGAFMERITGLRQGGSMELLFMLHEAHRIQAGVQADDLAEMLQWGPVTLRDMSEVDSHLLDLDLLYRDLRSFHEIDAWSFKLDPLSPGQERLLHAWGATGELHRILAERMYERGVATSGAIARRAAEMAQRNGLPLPWRMVWFAGLNALDPASTAVARHLQAQGKAQMAWDADKYYLEDTRQEAGTYLRRSIAALGPGVLPPVDLLKQHPRTVHAVAVPNALAQARYAAQHLASLGQEDRSSTAVVLADEHLLMPFLEALPPDIGPVNVTMGLPLEALPIHGLTEAFLELHASSTGDAFHHKALEHLLLHPFLHRGLATSRTIAAMRKAQRMLLRRGLVEKLAADAGMPFSPFMSDALDMISDIQAQLPKGFNGLLAWAGEVRQNDPFAQEQLFRMARLQQRLHKGLDHAGVVVQDLRTYALLRMRLVREERLSFFGEPLAGLQVMGPLETRAIDHERVLLLGANEGTLPKASGQQSWIPHEIRRTYRLPLQADGESITAYHFYRMGHCASDLFLIHDAGSKAAGPTRFLAQWQRELVGASATRLEKRTMAANTTARNVATIEVEKDAAVMARVDELLAKGLSPSALGTWLRCPLDLYFSYILRLRPPEEVDEKLGSDVLGEAVHQVLEAVFREQLGQPLQPGPLRQNASLVKDRLLEELGRQFPRDTLDRGHFRLRIEMAAQAMASYLHAEAERCASQHSIPLGLELDVQASIGSGVLLRGRCDRVEERDGVIHILDLKTGGVQPKDLELPGLERMHFDADRRFALQLLVYAWAYLAMHPTVARVRAGIVPLQKSSLGQGVLLKVAGSADLERSMMPAMEELLMGLITELRDTSLPFRHDPDSTYCRCCLPS